MKNQLIETKTNPDDLGWMQCSQCGWGTEVEGWEVLAGDYHDGQACQDCGLGPCRLDWTWVGSGEK